MINIQQIAEKLIQNLEAASVGHRLRAEGVKLLYDTITQEVQDAQKKEEDEQRNKSAEQKAADQSAEAK